jgi:hypothetical protein
MNHNLSVADKNSPLQNKMGVGAVSIQVQAQVTAKPEARWEEEWWFRLVEFGVMALWREHRRRAAD